MFLKYQSKLMSEPSICTRLPMVLIVALFFVSPVELQDGKRRTFKGDVIYSGYPPIEPNMEQYPLIETIDGDLTIQNYANETVYNSNYDLIRALRNVTGTVTIKNVSCRDFGLFNSLNKIGGNLIMQNNPELEFVSFLKKVSVKGSIKGGNCPKLYNKEYAYLISVDEKYLNLFDEDSYTYTGDVDILEDIQILDKRVITGSLICKSANQSHPRFDYFDGLLVQSMNRLHSIGSLLYDDCPMTSLSTTFTLLKRVDSKVEIINNDKLEDKEFSDWLYKIKINPANMVLKNNTNVCLEREHVDEWTKKKATISKHKICGALNGDVNLDEPKALIAGTKHVNGTISCIEMNGTNFSSDAINFLANLKSAKSLEFIQCEPLVNFKKIFPKRFPEVDNVTITSCPNFEPDLDVLALVKGKSESLKLTDNRNMCYTDEQLQANFSRSIIKMSDSCKKAEEPSAQSNDPDETSKASINVLDVLYLMVLICFLL